MKQIQWGTLFIVTILLLLSCESEGNRGERVPAPALSRITISEKIIDADGNVDRKEVYSFNNRQQLTQHTMTQTYGKYTPPSVIECCTDIMYSGNEVRITDSFGNQSVYTLNELGYANRCLYQEGGVKQSREYTFAYINDSFGESFLSEITEYVDNKFHSRIAFEDFTTNSARMIVSSIGITNTFQLSFHTPNYSRLPLLALTDIHPLHLHQEAMYARLIGDNPLFLLDQIDVVGGDEHVYYTYQNDRNGHLKSCTETNISGGYSYNRSLYYEMEPAN